MYKKFSQLSFVIGLFFSLAALILFGNYLANATNQQVSLYTAIVFLFFGIIMMLIKSPGSKFD
jgi:NO-binding membrane sensor protein with MHYT domain